MHASLVALLATLQGAGGPSPLRVGETVAGEITDDDPVLGTERLADEDPMRPPVGRTYRLEVAEAGYYTVELRSDFFDAYLAVRDEWGGILGEDDDGLFPTDARVAIELETGTHLVEPMALRGGRGPFELVVARADGPPADLPDPGATRRELAREIKALFDLDSMEHALGLLSLANGFWRQGRYGEGRLLHERGLRFNERHFGPNDPRTAVPLNNLAVLLNDLGLYDEARSLHERALRIREEALGPDDPDTAMSLSNLAIVLKNLGRHDEARPLYERALRSREERLGPDHPDVALTLANLGLLLSDLGLSDDALALLERALQIRETTLGPDHPATAHILDNLGTALALQGRHAEARAYLERSLKIRQATLGSDHPDTVINLLNLADALDDLGLDDEALPAHETAIEACTRALGPEHAHTATSIFNLAEHLVERGDYGEAERHYEHALRIYTNAYGPRHPAVFWTLRDLARLHADLGDLDEAWELVRRAEHDSAAQLARVLSASREAEGFVYAASLRHYLELLLSLGALLREATSSTEAYEALLAWKGRVTRLIESGRARLSGKLPPDQQELIEELRSVQGMLSALVFRADVTDRAAHEDELARLQERREELELRWQRLARDHEEREVTFDDLRAALDPDVAALDFFLHRVYRPAVLAGGELERPRSWSEPRLSAWITRPESEAPIHVDLGEAAAIERAAGAFLADLVARRGVAAEDAAGGDLAAELRALLWDPLAPHLEGAATVLVSPDGFLGTLPFEAIEDEEGAFLVERFAFAYRNDLASLALAPERERAPLDSALAAGGLDFRERGELEGSPPASASDRGVALRGSFAEYWAPLPHTAYESELVRALHEDAFAGGRRLLLQGPAATEERLKAELPRHRLLHLATHGFFQPEGLPNMWEVARDEAGRREARLREGASRIVGHHPALLSGLVCSGANARVQPGRDDGLLTAEEVGWLDLSGAELVVLSACETALGRPRSGEGMLGLRRAFHTAGARTVISSLWAVRDESTSELMQAFYVNLWRKGMGRLEALRSAQLAMLERNLVEHGAPLPSTWAAFVLSGEWR